MKVHDWVAAVYDQDWYIGKVTDEDTDEYQINFLTRSGKYGKGYKFPMTKDEIFVKKTDVLSKIEELQVVGKARKCYKLTDKDENMIVQRSCDYTRKQRHVGYT